MKTAIPNQWYAIEECRRVANAPVGIKRMGVDLVLYRDTRGELVCMRDRCPHKGVQLSRGRVDGDRIVCGYHGFEFDATGRCLRMPVIGKAGRIPKAMCVSTYVVREAYGLVWLWWGEVQSEAELPPIQIWPVFEEASRTDSTLSWALPVHYTRYVESLTEAYHVPFVHSQSKWEQLFNPLDARIDNLRIDVNGNMITSRFLLREDSDRSDEQVLNDWRAWRRAMEIRIDVMVPNLNYYEMKFPYPGTMVYILVASAPIDEDNTWVIFRYKVVGNTRLTGNPLFRKALSVLACRYEKHIAQPGDMHFLETAKPRVSDLREEQFGAFDRLVIEYLKIRERLMAESSPDVDARGRLRVIADP